MPALPAEGGADGLGTTPCVDNCPWSEEALMSALTHLWNDSGPGS